MTTRNLTKKLESYRLEYKRLRGTRSDFGDANSSMSSSSLLDDEEGDVRATFTPRQHIYTSLIIFRQHSFLHHTFLYLLIVGFVAYVYQILLQAAAVRLHQKLPPTWMDIVDGIRIDMGRVREGAASLIDLHDARLRVAFDDEEHKQTDQNIEILTREITRLLKKCEGGIKQIAHQDNAKGTELSAAEKTIRLNVMRNLATELKALSKDFRRAQTKFMSQLKNQNAGVGGFESKSNEAEEEAFDSEHTAALQEIEIQASQRDQEINDIVRSVNELSELFSELDKLVIEQGTILDRIDYNVEQTLTKVVEGTEQIRQADDYSKRSCTLKMMCFFLLVITVEVLILVFRRKNN